ncbi:Sad1 / UNC-like C-terminal family protein [Cryptosporidium felis]|nr:Sad1 / UNC-like C-terminal family protein [Cryptosporidium felis]
MKYNKEKAINTKIKHAFEPSRSKLKRVFVFDKDGLKKRYLFENRKSNNVGENHFSFGNERKNHFRKKGQPEIKPKLYAWKFMYNLIFFIRGLCFWLITTSFVVIFVFSINKVGYYGENKILTSRFFEKVISGIKIINLIQQGKENEIFFTKKDEYSDYIEIRDKFDEIGNQVIALNKKIGILAEINRISDTKNNNFENSIRELINNETQNIESQLNQLNEQIAEMRNSALKNVKDYPSNYYEIKEQIKLIWSNFAEFNRTVENINSDLNKISEEVYLINEAQDILRSALWSISKKEKENRAIESVSSNPLSLIQFQEIEAYISNLIHTKLDMQGHTKIDWAQSSMGGKVTYPKSNKYCKKNRNRQNRSIIIRSISYIQEKVLDFLFRSQQQSLLKIPNFNSECFEPNQLVKSEYGISIGNCLPLNVGSSVEIQLSTFVNVSEIGIDHIPFPLEYDKGSTVPRKVMIVCIQSSRETHKEFELVNLTYYYPQNGNSLQLFQIHPAHVCNRVRFTINSTYGGKFACLYKLRVYGESYFQSTLDSENKTTGFFTSILGFPRKSLSLLYKPFNFTTNLLRIYIESNKSGSSKRPIPEENQIKRLDESSNDFSNVDLVNSR